MVGKPQIQGKNRQINARDMALRGRIGGLVRASRYSPEELTAAARQGFLNKFLREVDALVPDLAEEERQRRARCLLRSHMVRLARKSAQARRKEGASDE